MNEKSIIERVWIYCDDKSIEYHKHIFTNIQETKIIVLGTVPENKIVHMWLYRYIVAGGVMYYGEPYERAMG